MRCRPVRPFQLTPSFLTYASRLKFSSSTHHNCSVKTPSSNLKTQGATLVSRSGHALLYNSWIDSLLG